MNCSTHKNRPAVAECDRCGKPICQSCYESFHVENEEDEHLCVDCFKNAVRDEIAEVKSLKGMVIREFVFIIIGLIVGLVLGLDICFGFGITTKEATGFFMAPIYLPFIVGSLLTIIKKIKNQYSEARVEGDDTNWVTLLFIVIINLFLAPITTTMRFIQRIGDMIKMNRIARNDESLIVAVDDYIARSLQPSAVTAASEGTSEDVEISLDAILASGAGSDAALCDNGEILRTVRAR